MTDNRIQVEEARALARYLRYLGCRDDVVDDLIQDARLALLQVHPDAKPVTDRLAFLRTCARNRYIDRLRAGQLQTLANDALVLERDRRFTDLAGDDMGASFIVEVRDCMDRLEERDRRALRCQYWDRQDGAEIARDLAISVSALKKLVARARARMKACLERKLR